MKKYNNFLKKVKYTLFLGILLLNASCDDRIDLKPTQLITDEIALTKLTDYNSALLGAYGATRGVYLTYVSTTDRTADDVKVGVNNLGQGLFLYNMNFFASEGSFATIWGGGYSAINRCNHIINRIPSLNVTTPTDIALKNKILSEALALRAMIHFDLLRVFANRYQGNGSALGIPYLKIVVAPGYRPARNTISEVMNEVIADLNQAESLNTTGLNANTVTQFSKPAIQALKARCYLYMGDYTNALASANTAITSSGLALSTGTTYANMWGDAVSGETIFKIKYLTGQGALGLEYWGENLDTNFFTPTNDLRSLYSVDATPIAHSEANDIRYTSFFSTAVSGPVIIKHRGPAPTPSADYGRVDIKWIRLSELFLIRAEANAELNNEGLAKDAIKALRTARISSYNTANTGNDPNLDAATGATLKSIIQIERRKELCYEGHRFLDLKRLNQAVVRVDCNAAPSTSCTLAASAQRFTYPIPQGELNANPNMVQNPGY